MTFFKLMAALAAVLAVSATELRATDGKPGEAAPSQEASSQAETPADPETAPEAKGETTAPDARPTAEAEKDTAADPAPTASTSPAAKPDTAASAAKPLSLTIASWGGAYAESQELAFIEPFRDATGAEVTLVSHGGEFGKLDASWDVVDIGQQALRKACEEGLLERIEADDIAAPGAEAPSPDDFLPGALQDCGVATVAWSAAIVFDKDAFEKDQPKTAADFFDLDAFPGNRAIPSDPKYLLPLALMADGVAPGDVYKTLENEDGVKRALAKLETIRNAIVWWREGDQPIKLVGKNYASMALAFSSRIFYAMARDNRPLGLIWDGQIYDLDLWAVPKDAANREAAMKFIAFSLQPDRLAAQTKWFPYGPMRKSALAQVGRHAVLDIEMSGYLPTSPANFERALRIDPAWWAEHGKPLSAAFDAWMLTPPAPGEEPDADANAEAEGNAEDG